MKKIQCDCCSAEVNNHSHWYNNEKPRNMYELHTIHDIDGDTYEEMVICEKCLEKYLFNIDFFKRSKSEV